MKKIIIYIFIFLCICCGCSSDKKSDIINNEYSDEYIEIIPKNSAKFIENLKEDKVLLSLQEIQQYNSEIKSKTDTIYNLENINKLTKEQILRYINYYKIPKIPKYDGNIEITESILNNIIDNRNISEVKDQDEIKHGIVVKRSNLRAFPTDIHFYDKRNINDVDNIQESEIHVNTEVLIIHESKDKKWHFVITPNYVGWIKSNNIALATHQDLKHFINPDKFGIITVPMIEVEDTILDMSVKLPYRGVNENGYEFEIPIKNEKGFVTTKIITIPRDKAHIGYLPYTKRNLYIQAFKYEGVNYSWGGMDKGVDCSSYVSNVYRTFGFMFPRNTSSQRVSVGEIISLSNKTIQDKKEVLSNNFPSLIYQPGHVMIYLGTVDNKNYIIHASQSLESNNKVVFQELSDDSNYLKSIDRLILVQ